MFLELDVRRVSASDIPKPIRNRCEPGEQVWRVSLLCDDDTLNAFEDQARQGQKDFPHLEDDIGKEGICPTRTARVVHAIEHLLTQNLLCSGQIPMSASEIGDIALTVPGFTQDGTEIAATWIRRGLVADQVIDRALRNPYMLLRR